MHALCIIVKISLGKVHTHTQTYPHCSHLHHLLLAFTSTQNSQMMCVFSTAKPKGHNTMLFHGTLDRRRYLLLDHYQWIITHYFALTFTHSSQSHCWAQQHYLISIPPLSLPSVDVNIWQLCVCVCMCVCWYRFFSLIKTLEVLIGHYTLFSGPPACPPPLPRTLWSSDQMFRGNNSFPRTDSHRCAQEAKSSL